MDEWGEGESSTNRKEKKRKEIQLDSMYRLQSQRYEYG